MVFIDSRKQKHSTSSFVVVMPEWSFPKLNIMVCFDNFETAMDEIVRHNEIDCQMPTAFLCKVTRSTITQLKRTKDDRSFMRKLRSRITEQRQRERVIPGIYIV